MNTREQLERLLTAITTIMGHLEQHAVNITVDTDTVALLEKLIAERPCEEKDTIMVKHRGEEFWYEAQYIASCSSGVVALRDGVIDMFSQHKPLPKTYRVKPVPGEVMAQAKQAVRVAAKCELPPHPVMEYLANPENWEADDE